MIIGVITSRDVLLHPVTILSINGFFGFFKVLAHALSRKTYLFLNLMEVPR